MAGPSGATAWQTRPGDPADESYDALTHSAFSLPHGFRFSGSHAHSLSRTTGSAFFARFPPGDDDALPVPAVDSASAKTRLEVLQAWEVNFTILSLYVASFCAFIYVLCALSHVRSVWFASARVAPAGLVERACAGALRVLSAALPVLFALRLIAHGRPTHEQVWTGVLLAVGLLCSNPLTLAAAQQRPHYVALIANDAVYTTATYLYLLLSAHSYRILDHRALNSRSVYLWKPGAVLLYFFVKLAAGFQAHVVLGLVPFARVIAWAILLHSGRFSARVSVPVLITTALDTALTLWLFREVALTARFLARTPYLENRAKQLGFRCFVYQSMVFCVSIVALATVAILRLPRGILFRNFDDAHPDAFLQLETPAGHLGLAFVYFTWTVVLAYVNLPPGPLLPYTGHALSAYFQAVAASAPVAWLRARGFPFLQSRIVDADPECDPQSQNGVESGPLVPDDTIPLRYRHREWFLTLEEDRCSSTSPFSLSVAEAQRNSFLVQRQSKAIEKERQHDDRLKRASTEFSPHPLPATLEVLDVTPPADLEGSAGSDDFSVPGFLTYPQAPPGDSPSSGTDDNESTVVESDEETESNIMTSSGNTDSMGPFGCGLVIPVPMRVVPFDYGTVTPNPQHRELPVLGPELPLPLKSNDVSENRVRFETLTSPFPTSPLPTKRLLLRKNLFVMETQVSLANAAYLSYIPGNACEERVLISDTLSQSPKITKPLQHAASLSSDLESLAYLSLRDQGGNMKGPSGLNRTATVPQVPGSTSGRDAIRQPTFDDGTKFLVDPVQIARQHGFVIFRQISNLHNNTHATVLLGKDRVVVAFSGTRDARNWVANTKVRRCVFDNFFPEFEFELSADSAAQQMENGARYPTIIVTPVELNCEDGREGGAPARRPPVSRARRSAQPRRSRFWSGLRKSQSTDSLLHQSQHSWESTADSIGDPGSPVRPNVGSYGTLGRQGPFRGVLWDKFASADNHRRRRTPTQRVQVVAKTIAHEFMTIGQAKVHFGFANAYLSLRRQVLGALVELYGGNLIKEDGASSTPPLAHGLPLFLCGHSLGGSLATFAAFEAAKYFRQIGLHQRQDISCTTFGCPMVGNDVFKSRYERVVETHWRFELASDPVPKMPTFLNYTHVGVRVLLDQSGMLLIDPSFIEVHWWGRLSNPYLGYKLHIRASYIMALRLYCELYKGGQEKLEHAFWLFPIKAQTKGVFVLPSR